MSTLLSWHLNPLLSWHLPSLRFPVPSEVMNDDANGDCSDNVDDDGDDDDVDDDDDDDGTAPFWGHFPVCCFLGSGRLGSRLGLIIDDFQPDP